MALIFFVVIFSKIEPIQIKKGVIVMLNELVMSKSVNKIKDHPQVKSLCKVNNEIVSARDIDASTCLHIKMLGGVNVLAFIFGGQRTEIVADMIDTMRYSPYVNSINYVNQKNGLFFNFDIEQKAASQGVYFDVVKNVLVYQIDSNKNKGESYMIGFKEIPLNEIV